MPVSEHSQEFAYNLIEKIHSNKLFGFGLQECDIHIHLDNQYPLYVEYMIIKNKHSCKYRFKIKDGMPVHYAISRDGEEYEINYSNDVHDFLISNGYKLGI